MSASLSLRTWFIRDSSKKFGVYSDISGSGTLCLGCGLGWLPLVRVSLYIFVPLCWDSDGIRSLYD